MICKELDAHFRANGTWVDWTTTTDTFKAGDANQIVSRVGTGTGAINDPTRMVELGADVGVIVEDFFAHVRMGVQAAEMSFPLIVVNHAVAEAWGIANLATYLQRIFPALEMFHIPQVCPYTVLSSSELE